MPGFDGACHVQVAFERNGFRRGQDGVRSFSRSCFDDAILIEKTMAVPTETEGARESKGRGFQSSAQIVKGAYKHKEGGKDEVNE